MSCSICSVCIHLRLGCYALCFFPWGLAHRQWVLVSGPGWKRTSDFIHVLWLHCDDRPPTEPSIRVQTEKSMVSGQTTAINAWQRGQESQWERRDIWPHFCWVISLLVGELIMKRYWLSTTDWWNLYVTSFPALREKLLSSGLQHTHPIPLIFIP